MTCTASRTNGEPCRQHAIKGGSVCRTHGGAAPQVRAKANERLLAMVDPALGVLARATRPRRGKALKNWEPTAQEISAAKEILNRAGIGQQSSGPEDGIHTGSVTWEEFIQIHRKGVIHGSSGTGE